MKMNLVGYMRIGEGGKGGGNGGKLEKAFLPFFHPIEQVKMMCQHCQHTYMYVCEIRTKCIVATTVIFKTAVACSKRKWIIQVHSGPLLTRVPGL